MTSHKQIHNWVLSEGHLSRRVEEFLILDYLVRREKVVKEYTFSLKNRKDLLKNLLGEKMCIINY